MAPLFSSTGGSATGTQATSGSRTQRLKQKAQELKDRTERRIRPTGGGGGDDTGDGDGTADGDDGGDLDPGEAEAPDTERVSRAQRKAENRSRIQRLKDRVSGGDTDTDDGDDADPQRVQARQEQLRSRQFDSRRQAKIAAAQRKIQGIAQAARDASASIDPDSVGQDMTMQASPGRERALAEGDPGLADEFDPAPGPSRMGATDRAGYDPVPGPSRRTAEDRAIDPDAVGGEDPVPGNGAVGTEIELAEQPTLGGSVGQESRVDLANPQTQRELERQAETDIVDAAENVGGTALDVVEDVGSAAVSNPYKTAAATAASPIPGDEIVGGSLAVGATGTRVAAGLLAGGTAAVGLSRSRSEIPVPSNPFDRGTNEIPVGEQFPITETVTPDVNRPAEIAIPEGNFREPEIPVGEGVQDQPEIPVSGDTGTSGQPTQGQPTESPVPDNYPIDPRRRQSVQERILRREAGQQVIGQQRERGQRRQNPFRERSGADEEELQEILDIDPTTIGEPEPQQRQFRERRFFTGEDAVVGRGATPEDVGDPEVQVETGTQLDQTLSQASDALGSGSTGEVPPPPPFLREQVDQQQQQDQLDAVGGDLRTRPKADLATGAVDLQQSRQELTPDAQQDLSQDLTQDVTQEVVTETDVVPETAAPTATPPEPAAPGFETGPGFDVGFGDGGQSSRPRRPPVPNFDPDGDDRRRRDPGGLAVFENPIASAEEVVGTPSGDPVGLDLGGGAGDYDPTGFSLDLDDDGGVF